MCANRIRVAADQEAGAFVIVMLGTHQSYTKRAKGQGKECVDGESNNLGVATTSLSIDIHIPRGWTKLIQH